MNSGLASLPAKPVEWQIVGVFHNVRGAGFREDYPEIDVPFWQNPSPRVSVVLQTDGEPKAVINSVAAAVNSVDPDMPLAGVRTVDEIVGESLAIDRFSVVLFASFGALGLLLAAVGIYGVMALGSRNELTNSVCGWPWERRGFGSYAWS